MKNYYGCIGFVSLLGFLGLLGEPIFYSFFAFIVFFEYFAVKPDEMFLDTHLPFFPIFSSRSAQPLHSSISKSAAIP